MEKDDSVISINAARLILGYLHNSLTESQKDELDEWICSSDENMKIFEDLTLEMDKDVFDPLQFIIETEEATELWVIAGLIIRRQQQSISVHEQKTLDNWMNASERNKQLLEKLQNHAFLVGLLSWIQIQRNNIFISN